MTRSLKSSNRRDQRIRRWLNLLSPEVASIKLQVLRGDDYDTLHVLAWTAERSEESEAIAVGIDGALQDEANTLDAITRGRLVALVADSDEPVSTLSMRCPPDGESEVLAEGQYDGSSSGQIAQLQQLLQAMVRMGIEERLATTRGFKQLMEAQVSFYELAHERWQGEAETADELREQVAGASDHGDMMQLLETFKPLADVAAQAAAAAIARKSGLRRAPPANTQAPPTAAPPVVEATHEPETPTE